jgi:hypothetical protein
VIIGFGLEDRPGKRIYEYDDIRGEPHAVAAANINPYLVDASDVVLPRRSRPICKVPEIGIGNKPIDDGNYLFTTEERDAFIAKEPASEKWFQPLAGVGRVPERLRALVPLARRLSARRVARHARGHEARAGRQSIAAGQQEPSHAAAGRYTDAVSCREHADNTVPRAARSLVRAPPVHPVRL